MTPPPEERAARKAYISKDDFAELLGVSRSQIYRWTSRDPEKRTYPEEPFRMRLAEVSGGRYTPDDFARPGGSTAVSPSLLELQRRLGELEAHVADLATETRHLGDQGGHREDQVERLADRVEALERRVRIATDQTRKSP